MAKYRKKPVVVEAVQFFPDKLPLPPGVEAVYGDCPLCGDSTYDHCCEEPLIGHALRTLNGKVKISPGEWIITGVKGDLYPCDPDIFAVTHEPVEQPPPGAMRDSMAKKPPPDKAVPCKECGKLIIYAKNFETGKTVPVDYHPPLYNLFRQEDATEPGGFRWYCERIAGEVGVNHFYTCTNPSRFSKGGKGGKDAHGGAGTEIRRRPDPGLPGDTVR